MMDAVTFVKEKQRMCISFGDICEKQCPLMERTGVCLDDDWEADPSEVVSKVEQWSKEHPIVTNGDKVMEIIKDAGIPVTARGSGFDREVPVNTVHIAVSEDWWDAEYMGEETAQKCDNCIYNPMNLERA